MFGSPRGGYWWHTPLPTPLFYSLPHSFTPYPTLLLLTPCIYKFKKSNKTYKIQNGTPHQLTSNHFHFFPYVTSSLFLNLTPCPTRKGRGGGVGEGEKGQVMHRSILFHPLNIIYWHATQYSTPTFLNNLMTSNFARVQKVIWENCIIFTIWSLQAQHLYDPWGYP